VAWYTQTFRSVKYRMQHGAFLPSQCGCRAGDSSRTRRTWLHESGRGEFGELKTHRDGTRSCYINDPSGNAVEIFILMSAMSLESPGVACHLRSRKREDILLVLAKPIRLFRWSILVTMKVVRADAIGPTLMRWWPRRMANSRTSRLRRGVTTPLP